MSARKSSRPEVSPSRRRRRSLGAEILARTLADRRVLIRKLVIGEAIGERPQRGLAVRPGDGDQPGDGDAG